MPPTGAILPDIRACLGFYTRFPTGGGEIRSFAAAQWAAPIAGLAVGLAGGVGYAVAAWLDLPEGVAAAAALGITMLATGCLHEDGLADVADGFGGGRDREAKLAIMRDSRIGAYGVAALGLSMIARWSAITALAAPGAVLPAMLAAHAASRALFPAFMRTVPPARADGLSAGVGAIEPATATTALALAVVASLLCIGLAGTLIAAFALALWFFTLEALCRRQIGGQTGDVLGTLQQGAEIIMLCVASALFT